ncbi:hypothetical protein GOP47_0010468 [Adiantum capillus-veneris]|uniref:Uncharacterized protein n=1 Tax=Adiantum capillus-veneris TaxID=13818 RepID=A0A9D4UVC3_ADICA|nr:hypothetical protein GOP47_0010468 [Adiantum capillus-veneris]
MREELSVYVQTRRCGEQGPNRNSAINIMFVSFQEHEGVISQSLGDQLMSFGQRKPNYLPILSQPCLANGKFVSPCTHISSSCCTSNETSSYIWRAPNGWDHRVFWNLLHGGVHGRQKIFLFGTNGWLCIHRSLGIIIILKDS